MKTYSVYWTPTALKDLTAVLDKIEFEKPLTAEKLLDHIELAGSSLSKNPKRGRVPPEIAGFPDLSIRELIINPWRLIYRIENNQIQILAFLDNRMNLEEFLYYRLLRS